jgi:hypothetical protein
MNMNQFFVRKTALLIAVSGTYRLAAQVFSGGAADGSGTVIFAKNTEAYATNALTAKQVSGIRNIGMNGINSSSIRRGLMAPNEPQKFYRALNP